ncbi:MAG: hypothetical protein COC05_03005 [Gammaproteobacteria bacterium]|nr:MAG: hypothetical protein COC05_03005 [Gammaproteobacteria bacterium]
MHLAWLNVNRLLDGVGLFAITTLIMGNSYAAELSGFVADTISAHPNVREQVHIFRQTTQDKVIAISGWKPRVDFDASVGKFDSKSPVTGPNSVEFESSRAELSLTQNLYNGFDTTNQINQTQARINAALFEVYDTADNIALEATQAYLEVLKQQRLYELAIKNVDSHEDILEQIQVRSLSGVGRRSQLEQTEGRVARAHASLIAQQNNLQDAATAFHQVAGRYVDPSMLVEPKLPEQSSLSIEDLTTQALKNHPALRVAEYNILAAQADYRRSRSKNQPTVDLRLAQEVGQDINGLNGSTDDLSLVLNFNYNLYRGGADRAEQRQKISAVHEREQFAARVRRQVINTLRLAWAADKSLGSQLAFLQEHVVKSGATLDSYREEFFIGQRALINVLDAENELNTALNRHTEAHFDFLAARYRIHEGLGSLFESLNLDAKIDDQDLLISRVQAKGEDTLPYNMDRDTDTVVNLADHCDNTIEKDKVNGVGCKNQPAIDFDKYQAFDVSAGDAGYRAFAIKDDTNVIARQLNTAPTLIDDELELVQDTIFTIPYQILLANDSDAENDLLSIQRYSQPDNGKLASDDNENLIYRPYEAYVGKDNFTYTVSDSEGNSSTATVHLLVSSADGIDLTEAQYVNFLFNETKLTDASKDKIDLIVAALKNAPDTEAWVFAHTDNLGSNSYNLSLSKRRANVLRQLLIDMGVDERKIKANGIGENKPLADNNTGAGRAINRRGEFHFRASSGVQQEQK